MAWKISFAPRHTTVELVVDANVAAVHNFDIVARGLAVEHLEEVLAFAALASVVLACAVASHAGEEALKVHFGGCRWRDLAYTHNHS